MGQSERKGLGPDLSTVDWELQRLFSKAKYPRRSEYEPWIYPTIGGDTEKDVRRLRTLVDEYKQIIPGVTSSLDLVDVPSAKRFYGEGPRTSPGTILMGYFKDKPFRRIGLSPMAGGWPERSGEYESTLAHELAHAGGFEHGRHLSNIEGVGRMRGEYKEQWKKGIK